LAFSATRKKCTDKIAGLRAARRQGVDYECKFEEIDGLDGRPHPLGNGGSLRRIEVAGSADSRGRAGVVWSRADVAEWPELTAGVRIEEMAPPIFLDVEGTELRGVKSWL
jgi:hypothetical protein